MRKLDELLQDIPLDELLGSSSQQQEQAQRSGRRIKHTGNAETVKLKSRVSAVAAAAVIALGVGAAAVYVAAHRGEITPRASVSMIEADPIKPSSLPESREQSSKNDQSVISSPSEKHAQALYSAMLLYLQTIDEDETQALFDAGELFVSFDSGQERSELAEELAKNTEQSLTGKAFFVMHEGKLRFAEWTNGEELELYPDADKITPVSSFGEYPESCRELLEQRSGSNVSVTVTASEGREAVALDKEKADELASHCLALAESLPQAVSPEGAEKTDTEKYYEISVRTDKGTVFITSSAYIGTDISVGGAYYDTGTDIFKLIEEQSK